VYFVAKEFYLTILKRPIKKMTERHAAQAPALRERLPQIFNLQSSIFNSPPSADQG
jgi:hypothetical protein